MLLTRPVIVIIPNTLRILNNHVVDLGCFPGAIVVKQTTKAERDIKGVMFHCDPDQMFDVANDQVILLNRFPLSLEQPFKEFRLNVH